MTLAGKVRLLGPAHRRLVALDMTRERDRVTAQNLVHAGWTPYDGPGEATPRGWFIPATDPGVPAPHPFNPRKVQP